MAAASSIVAAARPYAVGRADAVDVREGGESTVVVVGGGLLGEALVRLLWHHGVAASRADERGFATSARRRADTVLVLVGTVTEQLVAVARRNGCRVVVCGDTPVRHDEVVVLNLDVEPDDLVNAVTGAQPRRRSRRGRTPVADKPSGGVLAQLTAREVEVLRLLMAGRSGTAMAASLGISPHTVRTHVQNILGKLGVRTRLQAATLGHRAGLGAVPARGTRDERPGRAHG